MLPFSCIVTTIRVPLTHYGEINLTHLYLFKILVREQYCQMQYLGKFSVDISILMEDSYRRNIKLYVMSSLSMVNVVHSTQSNSDICTMLFANDYSPITSINYAGQHLPCVFYQQQLVPLLSALHHPLWETAQDEEESRSYCGVRRRPEEAK